MEELSYSLWHRSLGYSYFAMDLDYVEIRDDQPVALIEASLCTPSHPTCSGERNVFNRFLSETGGFQFEVVYWSARWLGVKAYVVCMKKLVDDPNGDVEILSLANGEWVTTDIEGYKQFINALPDTNGMFSNIELDLPSLLEKLAEKFEGIRVYPYFKDKKSWTEDYLLRMKELSEKSPRNRIPKSIPEQHPVKGETTGERPKDYEILRSEIELPYVNINWVEWRKDNSKQKIGRPAVIIKTMPVYFSGDGFNPKKFQDIAEKGYAAFKNSREPVWWDNIAKRMAISWYFVAYPIIQNIGEHFKIWRPDGKQQLYTEQEYTEWITTF